MSPSARRQFRENLGDKQSAKSGRVPGNGIRGCRQSGEPSHFGRSRRRERRKVIALNRLGDAALHVRRDFVSKLLTRKTSPKGAAIFVATYRPSASDCGQGLSRLPWVGYR
jgi:hypothetical protein